MSSKIRLINVCLIGIALLFSVSCEKEEAFSPAHQRGVVETFTKAAFRNDSERLYQLLSKQDQQVIAQPLTTKDAETYKLKPASLFQVVDTVNPYNIKDLQPTPTFDSKPEEGSRATLLVTTYDSFEKRFDLIWEDGSWHIFLGLK